MFYSPLRYPGGKNRLARFIEKICVDNDIYNHYIEPYAGGAAIALHLLIEGKVKQITINDYDRSIYAFWYSVLRYPEELCYLIETTDINIDNWYKAKNIQKNKEKIELLKLGFSTFFLNRVNRSGIINAGVIGGINQKGNSKLNCRFNKNELIKRIKLIAEHKKQINLYHLDALDLIKKIQATSNNKNTIFYFDPPYYHKGASLYMNYYKNNQHEKVAEGIRSIRNIHWILSYDDALEIEKIYTWVERTIKYQIKHFANKLKIAKEIIFFSESIKKIDLKLIENQIL